MASREESEKPRRPPATSPLARERQLIALSYDQAERQIRAGTASSQVLSHFLKMGSSREVLEQERLELENSLSEAKIEALASQARVEEMYKEAMDAFRSYAGEDNGPIKDDSYDEDY